MKLPYFIAYIKIADDMAYVISYDGYSGQSKYPDLLIAFAYYKNERGEWRSHLINSASGLKPNRINKSSDLYKHIKAFEEKWWDAIGNPHVSEEEYFNIKRDLFELLTTLQNLGIKCKYIASTGSSFTDQGTGDIDFDKLEAFLKED